MSVPVDYTTLQATIAGWLKRDDLSSSIPEFIAYGEANINRVCRLLMQETLASIITTPGSNSTPLPADFLDYISLTYDRDLYYDPIKVDITVLDTYKNQITAAPPTHFAISDGFYYWNYIASDAFNLTQRYWKKWNIASTSTNWLLTNYPDVYVKTALSIAGQFIRHPLADKWDAAAEKVLKEIAYESAKARKATLRVDQGLISRFRNRTYFNINQGY